MKIVAFNKMKALFTSKLDLKQTNKMLHLEHSFVWCWDLETSRSRANMCMQYWNVVLEKVEKISWTD